MMENVNKHVVTGNLGIKRNNLTLTDYLFTVTAIVNNKAPSFTRWLRGTWRVDSNIKCAILEGRAMKNGIQHGIPWF